MQPETPAEEAEGSFRDCREECAPSAQFSPGGEEVSGFGLRGAQPDLNPEESRSGAPRGDEGIHGGQSCTLKPPCNEHRPRPNGQEGHGHETAPGCERRPAPRNPKPITSKQDPDSGSNFDDPAQAGLFDDLPLMGEWSDPEEGGHE